MEMQTRTRVEYDVTCTLLEAWAVPTFDPSLCTILYHRRAYTFAYPRALRVFNHQITKTPRLTASNPARPTPAQKANRCANVSYRPFDALGPLTISVQVSLKSTSLYP